MSENEFGTRCLAELDFWEWINILAESSPLPEQPTEEQRRLLQFFQGKSTEKLKIVIASPSKTQILEFDEARLVKTTLDKAKGGVIDIEIGDDMTEQVSEPKSVDDFRQILLNHRRELLRLNYQMQAAENKARKMESYFSEQIKLLQRGRKI